MNNYDLLIKAAEILEKTAAHIESAEADAYQVVSQHQEQSARKIASQLSSIAGTPVAHETVMKMAGLGPDVASMLSKLAGANTLVDDMGGPDMETKTASAPVDPDGRFLDWLRS